MVTTWTPSSLYYTDGNTYSSNDPSMQLYASYRYRKNELAILCGESMASAVPYRETQLISGNHSIEPSAMPPKLAQDTITEFVTKSEQQAASDYILCV